MGRHMNYTICSDLEKARYNGERCYRVEISGDINSFKTGEKRVLHTEKTSNGHTLVYYIPDQDFAEYAAKLDRLGAWS